jgi:hypothetical protein
MVAAMETTHVRLGTEKKKERKGFRKREKAILKAHLLSPSPTFFCFSILFFFFIFFRKKDQPAWRMLGSRDWSCHCGAPARNTRCT